MECLIKLQKRPKFIDAVEKFQLSGAYPVLFAALCVVSSLGNKYVYLPVLSVLALFILFSVLFVRDNKVLLVPIFMIFYSLGNDSPNAFVVSGGEVLASFDPDGFLGIVIIGVILVSALIIRLIADGSLLSAIKQRSSLLFGILVLDIAILLGGAFSDCWDPSLLVYAAVILFGLNFFFFTVYAIVKNADAHIITYACRILVITCLVISCQVLFAAYKGIIAGNLVFYSSYLDRWVVQRTLFFFSWGIPTHVGAITAIGIPAAMYLAKNERFPIFYYICAGVFLFMSVIVNTRSSMIVGGTFFVLCAVIACISGRNKKTNRIFSVCAVFVALISTFVVLSILSDRGATPGNIWMEIAKLFRLDLSETDGRLSLYEAGWLDFLDSPIFGIGFAKSTHAELIANNFYSNMYHSVIIQMLASAGIVGIVALLFHVKDLLLTCFKRFSADRLLLLCVPAMILCMSLVDNFFFYLNFQIPYVAFLLLAEKQLETKKALDAK